MRRRHLLSLTPLLLAGCGFQLRQAPDFAFNSIVINAPGSSPLAAELRRSLAADGKVQVLDASALAAPAGASALAAPAGASALATSAGTPASSPAAPAGRVIFDLLQEQREKTVVGVNAQGQVVEYTLRTRVRFRLRTVQGRELIPETELVLNRDISFNETIVLAKEAEETLLYRDMQTDMVQQLMRRLAAVRTV